MVNPLESLRVYKGSSVLEDSRVNYSTSRKWSIGRVGLAEDRDFDLLDHRLRVLSDGGIRVQAQKCAPMVDLSSSKMKPDENIDYHEISDDDPSDGRVSRESNGENHLPNSRNTLGRPVDIIGVVNPAQVSRRGKSVYKSAR